MLTAALIELYWREPVDLSIANVASIKKREEPDDDLAFFIRRSLARASIGGDEAIGWA